MSERDYDDFKYEAQHADELMLIAQTEAEMRVAKDYKRIALRLDEEYEDLVRIQEISQSKSLWNFIRIRKLRAEERGIRIRINALRLRWVEIFSDKVFGSLNSRYYRKRETDKQEKILERHRQKRAAALEALRTIQADARRTEELDVVEAKKNAFYLDCVQDFHEEAKKHGVATKGVIAVPELIPYGEKYIGDYLDDPFFQLDCMKPPASFYYAIMSLSMQAGMLFAKKWHEAPNELDEYAPVVKAAGTAGAALELMRERFPEIAEDKGKAFFEKILGRWLVKIEPYQSLTDPREYYLKATLAAYQLGVSMMLEKHEN